MLLAGCRSATTLVLDITFQTEDSSSRSSLITASERVIERRAYSIEDAVPELSVEEKDEKVRISVILQKEETVSTLGELLTSPISFFIMRAVEEGEEPDVSNEQYGDFKYTGLTERDLLWVTAEETPDGKATVTLTFTDRGKTLLQKVFEENAGKRIGLFVRGGLVSTYDIQEEEAEDRENIVISGVPSFELARTFADDVNVGTHITFTPVP